MTELYLITGFLGSGKSTFLKGFLRFFEGQNIQIIINEFGKEGVDGALLAYLQAGIAEITGGSVFCSCRIDQFENALQKFIRDDTQVVLVEASGLADPTGVKQVFFETNRYPQIHYKGCICLVDPTRLPKLIVKSRVCKKQLINADVLLLNKVDLVTPTQLRQTREIMENHCPGVPVVETSYGLVDDSLLDLVSQNARTQKESMPLIPDISLKSITLILNEQMSIKSLEHMIRMFIEDSYRVKGFVQTTEGLKLVNGVGNMLTFEDVEEVEPKKTGYLTVLSGGGMPIVKHVKEAMKWYPQLIKAIEA